MPSERKMRRRAILNESGLERAAARHPWIFRGNLRQVPECNLGDLIAFSDKNGTVIGWGLWSDSALSIRVLSYGAKEPDQMALLRERVSRALEFRKICCAGDEAFRWVHGEADGLPGIIADVYGDVLSLQISAAGWYRHAEKVASIFRKVRKLSAIVLRNESKHLEKEGIIPHEVRPLLGEIPAEPIKVKIGSLFELVDIAGGQKTGAYLDVRHVPNVLAPFCGNARVLDCFSYQGHLGLHALAAGASEVVAVEQSQAAIETAKNNLALNGLPAKMNWLCGNVFDIIRKMDEARERFDVVIMDPPPFSPGRGNIDSARRGYKELAVRGLKRLRDFGCLVFLSCSHAFTRDMLLETLASAALDEGVRCNVVYEIHQPPDHPVLLGVPETDYLKGFVLGVHR